MCYEPTNCDRPEAAFRVLPSESHREASLFGSVLRDDFGPTSDVDVLVEFEPEHVPGLLGIAGMELELEEIAGRKVDLRTPRDLSKYFRQEVIESAVLQYAS